MKRGRAIAFGVISVVLSIGLTTAVLATAGEVDRARQRAAAAPQVAGSGKGACRVGFDTETAVNTPPDDSTSDNPAAAKVTLKKSCSGAVIGQFTSEVSTSAAGDFIHLDMRATCVAGGGFATHCTVGSSFFAAPGHSFFQSNVQTAFETNAMNMVWTGLLPGKWKFEVLPGGNGTAFLDFRTFTVFALG